MGRPNYSFKKRQKELARKKKKEEKRRRKLAKNNPETLVHLYYRTGRLNLYQNNIDAASTSYQYALNIAKGNPEVTAQIQAETRLMYDLD